MRVAPPRASARTACQVPTARPPRPACARSPATTAPRLSRSPASAAAAPASVTGQRGAQPSRLSVSRPAHH